MEKVREEYVVDTKGIRIGVKIDYKNNRISIVEPNGQPKSFVFVDRGVEYMNGWLSILDVIKTTVQDAKKRYEAELAEQSKFQDGDVNVIKMPPIKAPAKKKK